MGEALPAADVVAAVSQPLEPLREAVLDGRFFSSSQHENAVRLAEFIAEPRKVLIGWFGPEAAALLAADRDAMVAAIDRDIAEIDRMIASQLDAILHHARLRKLEGGWRGLAWLVARMNISGRLKLRILNVTWAEICRDLEKAAEFDQSQIFRRVYEDEFGIAGGEPYGLLVVDHEVRHRPGPGAMTDDVTAIASLSAVAAAAFAPLVIGASPALFGVDEFSDLSGVADPAAAFVAQEYQRWKNLGTREDMRFVAVGLPRTLARLPWNETLDRHRGFRYSETAHGTDENVWSSSGYLVAACVMRAFAAFSWPADMRGYDIDRIGGGVVEDLPEPFFSIDPAYGLERPALEVMLTDRQERALVAAGLLPVGSLPFGGQALIGAARSLQVPNARFVGANADSAAANTRLSAQFNTMICVSRFAHYVKVMGRDMVGSLQTAQEIQKKLQTWLLKFSTSATSPGPDTMAKYPLRGASVVINEVPGKPGVYGCIIQLQPHFQLDDIAASFRLMTEIAAPGARR
jgi:type VI secretion system protein ImpD/type VI secretion system protein ImpC